MEMAMTHLDLSRPSLQVGHQIAHD